MSGNILPALTPILCDPATGDSVDFKHSHFLSSGGIRFPISGGIAQFKASHQPLRHRFWEWIYNRTAFGYDFGVQFAWKLSLGGAPIRRESYLDRINIREGDRVLETAAGTGDNLLQFPANAHYVALDQSIAMLRRCKQKLDQAGQPAAFIQADMAGLPFKDESFDVVFHIGGLQFMNRPSRGIDEMYRAAKSGASITIVDEHASLKSILRRSGGTQPEDLAPAGSHAVIFEPISQDELFLLQFKK